MWIAALAALGMLAVATGMVAAIVFPPPVVVSVQWRLPARPVAAVSAPAVRPSPIPGPPVGDAAVREPLGPYSLKTLRPPTRKR